MAWFRAALAVSIATLVGTTALLTTASMADSQEAVTLRMWSLSEEGAPEFFEYAKGEFAKTHPNVTIVNEFYPNEAYKTNLQIALVGSEPPDIFFNWAGEASSRLIEDKLVLDITDLGARPNGFMSEISDAWRSSFEKSGRRYGVPIEAVSKYFFYNIDYFEKHQLKVPATFDELAGVCRAVRAADPEVVPLPLGNSERWKVIHYISMLNDRVVGSQTTAGDYALTHADDALFADPGYIEAWQKLLELKSAGCFQDAPNATSPEVTRTMFSSEISPMIYCGTWCMPIIDAEGYKGYGLFRMPPVAGGRGDPNTNFLVPQGYQVSVKTPHADAAVEWLSFLVSGPVAAKFAEFRKAIPSNPDDIGIVPGATEQFNWMVGDVSKVSKGVNSLDVILEQPVAEAYLNAGVEILNGSITPSQAMDKIRAAAIQTKAEAAR